ncbi:MAG TPA: phosphomannomutase/phosphoglucomutase, partial [Spirochaetia bacterium]|nr:phosphomannomutase/phosphoglucomutase [Spirochaetia bacterium]
AVIAGLVASRGVALSQMVQPLRDRYAQSPEINVEVEDKDKALAEIERRFPGGKVDRLDGLSISFDDFWFNVRPSNTEPLLRLRLEARTAGIAAARSDEIKAILGHR